MRQTGSMAAGIGPPGALLPCQTGFAADSLEGRAEEYERLEYPRREFRWQEYPCKREGKRVSACTGIDAGAHPADEDPAAVPQKSGLRRQLRGSEDLPGEGESRL